MNILFKKNKRAANVVNADTGEGNYSTFYGWIFVFSVSNRHIGLLSI